MLDLLPIITDFILILSVFIGLPHIIVYAKNVTDMGNLTFSRLAVLDSFYVSDFLSGALASWDLAHFSYAMNCRATVVYYKKRSVMFLHK